MSIECENIQVVIFAGGQGTRLSEETFFKPKPMVEIGDMPILWHIMKNYYSYGFRRFVILVGYKGELIKHFFLHYRLQKKNVEFQMTPTEMHMGILNQHGLNENWEVRIIETGEFTSTGRRLAMARPYIDSKLFCLTYGDGLTNANLRDEIQFHLNHGKTGTVLGVYPQARFGELICHNDQVIHFNEKSQQKSIFINGGFFVFNHIIFNYVNLSDDHMFEKQPLTRLAEDNELHIFKHEGFWQCMDTFRDKLYLCELWKKNPPWKTWD